MAKVVIILFFLGTGLGSYYLTYKGIGQEEVVTIEKRQSVRSYSSSGGSGGGYSSGGYSYGK